ncbi:MAG: hypothetical protein N2509_03325 [Treponemataceae bacterium]|nr:hypothetical protein [Treponemataceae bacterium]
MSDALAFQEKLTDALDRRKEWLDRQEMPKLKEEFKILHTAFLGLYQVLLKKGLIHEDPYKHDVKIGELEIPPEGPFTESERMEEMSIRLSAYDSQLDFLVNFYQYSVDFFTLERIKRILQLVKYFNWSQFSVNSPYINTRALAEIIALVRGGNDQLSIGLVADALQVLDRSSREIFRILKEITDYHRESYKLDIRIRLMDQIPLDASTVFTQKEETLHTIKRKFAETITDRPFYPELVEEILRENYAAEGPRLKEEILKGLAVPEEKPKPTKTTVSNKNLLIEAFKILGTLSFTFTDVIVKIQENSSILESEKKGFWYKLKKLIQQMLNKDAEPLYYEVEYLDPVLGTKRTEQLNFTQFCVELERKSRYLTGLSTRGSSVLKKIEEATEESLLNTLTKLIEELQSSHRTLNALDEFFKRSVHKENRDRIRGIKPELSALKNSIVKANQKRHEYIAQKEEMEQLKKLGIKDE